MSSIKTALTGYVSYRGREGHLGFLLHRITGLGTLLFLTIHILDTATVYFAPSLYADAINIYRSTLFGFGEIALIFCLIYHGMNGIRIALFDWFPKSWSIANERKWATAVLVAAIVLWLPAFIIMGRNLLIYNFHVLGG
jgi:succinate dehydrogenase / fumarate reductase cytochrome b subunit